MADIATPVLRPARCALSLVVVALAVSLGGCARSRGEPSQRTAAVKEAAPAVSTPLLYPGGIVPPPDAARAIKLGIYAATTRVECCFLRKKATLVFNNPTPTSTVTLKVIVPRAKPFLQAPERIALKLNGIPSGTREAVPGLDNVSFTVPPALRNKTNLKADLSMSIMFVPKQIGYNSDTRELSVILVSVSYTR